MIQKLPAARQARVAALFVCVVGLAACGGGGGGGGGGGLLPGPPPPPPSTPLSLADCTALPAVGVEHRYLNAAVSGAWGKRVWQAANSASFPDATHERRDYAAASDAQPSEIWYFKADATTRTTLGFERLQGGTVTLRDKYEGWVESRTLAEGASETIDYTVHPLLPAGASSSERRVRTFTASRETTLPGGRINTCMVETVRHRSVPPSAPLGEFERERVHYAPGVGLVKRYLTPTHMTSLFDRNQVYSNELVSTTATPTWAAPRATNAPTLAACAAIVTGQTMEYTANDATEAVSNERRTASNSFNAASAVAIGRRNALSDTLYQVSYFGTAAGALQELGYQLYANNQVTSTVTLSGRGDLSTTPQGQTTHYAEITNKDGVTTTSNNSFTFIGHEKVSTYAGDFDTCAVRFDYQNGNSETFYLSPDVYWVRLDAEVGNVRTTREMVRLN